MYLLFLYLAIFAPSWKLFLNMEALILPAKGCWYRSILGTHMAIEQRGEASACRLWHGVLFLRSSPRTWHTHTFCQAFGKWAVTTGYNDIVLSRPNLERWSPACVVNVLPTEPPWWSYMYDVSKDLGNYIVTTWCIQRRILFIAPCFYLITFILLSYDLGTWVF